MEEYLDEICLLALCAIVLGVPSGNAFAIAGCLAAVVVVCASGARRIAGLAAQVAFVVCACFSSALLAFLPVVAYGLMHDRSWGVRLLWVVPLAVHGAANGLGLPWAQAAVLCAVACLLAVRDSRTLAERKGLTFAYDGLRERMLVPAEGAAVVEEERVPALFEGLTQREIAVAQLVAEGLDNREISQRLFLSEGTVRNHISSVLAKKDLTNRTQIAVMYYTS